MKWDNGAAVLTNYTLCTGDRACGSWSVSLPDKGFGLLQPIQGVMVAEEGLEPPTRGL